MEILTLHFEARNFQQCHRQELRIAFCTSSQWHDHHDVHSFLREFFMVFKGGYHFSGEPEKNFETFFGTSNPFDILND